MKHHKAAETILLSTVLLILLPDLFQPLHAPPNNEAMYSIEKAEVFIDLGRNNVNFEMKIKIRAETDNLTNPTLFIYAISPRNIFSDAAKVSVVEVFNPNLNINETFLKLDLNKTLKKGETSLLTVTFSSPEKTEGRTYIRHEVNNENHKFFTFIFKALKYVRIGEVDVTALLPEKADLLPIPPLPVINPKPVINTSIGLRKRFSWKFVNLTRESPLIMITYNLSQQLNSATPSPSPQPLYLTQILIITSSLTIGVIAILFFRRRREIIKTTLLTQDEKKLIEIIKEEGGKIEQKELPLKMGLSKATVSKIISKLEEKGILEKRGYGRTNIVILKEDVTT